MIDPIIHTLSKMKNGRLLISTEYHVSKALPTAFNTYRSFVSSGTTLKASSKNADKSITKPKMPKNKTIVFSVAPAGFEPAFTP